MTTKQNAGKTPYAPYSAKERLVPSILLSLAIPFTLFFFGPFEAYCKNIEEFGFAFGDIGWLSLAVALLVGVILFVLLYNLSGRVFDTVYAALAAIALMLYLQGNYLNLGLNAVQGDGVGVSTYTTAALVINLIVWLLVIGGVITAFVMIRKYREILRLASIVALVVVIGIQVMMFALLSLTTDVFVPMNERNKTDTDDGSATEEAMPGLLTVEGITEAGEDANIIWIVVDRFDLKYSDAILKADPDFYENLDGFTLYDNHITKYARTYPSIAYMLTGMENDYSSTRLDYFEKVYTEGTFLKDLAKNGYRIDLFTEKFYAYDNADVFSEYAANISSSTNYTILNRTALWGDMVRLVLFRYLPIFAKDVVGTIASGEFNDHIEYDSSKPMFEPDMKETYNWLTEQAMTTVEGKNFTFLHIDGCHMANKYYEDFSEVTEFGDQWDSNLSMRVSFKIINYYLDELKRLGLYEDATIVITGDHAAALSDTEDLSGSRVTTLLVKKKGESGTPLKTNSAPVEQFQIRASILESEGIVTENDYGPSIFDIPENASVKRYYRFQKSVKNGDDELVVYEVVGDAKDFKNWTLVERINVGELYQ